MREAFASGTRLGRYEIVVLLGAGGMGEVYRARDHELQREVAIKILPAAFAGRDDRLRRFELEARAAAALNHPNILALYDVGYHDGTPYIVSELLEGQSLRARLEGAKLPLRTAIEFVIQIAEGLAAAHDKGIVHRDLKPDNVFVTRDERLKILDFGLAKLVDVDAVTLTTPPQTSAGAVLGTVGYLSPEQASGLRADHRSDIFSVGAILFEMVTHRRAFARATTAQTLTAVLEDDPTVAIAAGAGLSARVMNVVRRCLDKSPERRFQSARDLALVLTNELSDSSLGSSGFARVRLPRLSALALALACLAIGTLLGRLSFRSTAGGDSAVVSFSIPLPAGDAFSAIAISRDGTHVVYASGREGRRQLYVRALDRGGAVPLAGTDSASSPVFSPDGKDIAFVADGKLKRIATSGGVVTMICNAPNPFGIAWGIDGYIIFAPDVRIGLSQVLASGGTPEPITQLEPNELSHRWPHVMDDGTILFAVRGVKDFRIDALSPRTRERRTIVGNAMFVQSAADRLVYVTDRGETFMARYDPSAISVQGAPIALTERPEGQVGTWGLALSRGGTLAYVPFEPTRRLMAVAGRDGSLHTLASEPKEYLFPRVSPDGRRIAVHINDGGNGPDIWVFDVERGTLARVTRNRNSFQPMWDSTGTTLTFGSGEEDNWSIRSQVVDSSNASTVVVANREGMHPHSWLPDGRTLLFSSWKSTAPDQLPASLVTAGGPTRAINLPPSDAGRYVQDLSPDGRWLAYVSNESGAWEAYITAFPGPGTTKQVSRGGGRSIRWAKTGTNLFYLRPPDVQPAEIMRVSIRPDGTVSQPMLVLKGGIARECENCPGFAFYDTFPDGSLLGAERREAAGAEAY